jgi:signal peptidase II
MDKKKADLWKWVILGVVFVCTLTLDQLTKWAIHSRFKVGESIDLVNSFLAFTYVRNKGAAFGILQTADPRFREPFFLAVPVIAIGIIAYLFYRLEPEKKVSAVALSLILSGAVGNLIDRARFGFVIDFIDAHWNDVYHWPAFNVADSCIVVGVGTLLILSFFEPKPAPMLRR